MTTAPADDLTLDDFFAGFEASRPLFEAVRSALSLVGPVEVRVTKSQVAFRRRTAFAWAWVPGRYLRDRSVPLVLSVALRRPDGSPRWKQVVEPALGRFMHHLELRHEGEVDDEVIGWLREAWGEAG